MFALKPGMMVVSNDAERLVVTVVEIITTTNYPHLLGMDNRGSVTRDYFMADNKHMYWADCFSPYFDFKMETVKTCLP